MKKKQTFLIEVTRAEFLKLPMAMRRKALAKQADSASLSNKLEKHRAAIAKERDGLRKLQDEITDLLEPTDRGVEALEDAICAISEQA